MNYDQAIYYDQIIMIIRKCIMTSHTNALI